MLRKLKLFGIAFVALLGLSVAALLLLLSHDSSCGAPPPPAVGASMRALVYRCYGGPSVARLERLRKPTIEPGRVLVKVAVASVNPLDWHYLRGQPYLMRLDSGFGAPHDVSLGVDFAGTVEAVGPGVTRFKPGDRLFGGVDGSLAEYALAREQGSLALIPSNVSFEQAAAVPIAAVTALQALRDKGHVRAGQRVLINGASGGVGTFAVQIATLYGASVTGVCAGRNRDLVLGLGASRVIDYTLEDFTRLDDRYDLIIDNVGNHGMSEYRRVLTPQGTVVRVGGVNCGICLGAMIDWGFESLVSSWSAQKRVTLLADLNPQDLATLADWMGAGRLHAAIDRRYPLDEAGAALTYLEAGHARAKILVDVDSTLARP